MATNDIDASDVDPIPTLEVLSKRVTRIMEALAETEVAHARTRKNLEQLRQDVAALVKMVGEHAEDLTRLYDMQSKQ